MRRALFVLLFLAAPLLADSSRRIERDAVVPVSRAEAWRAWASADGLKSWLADGAKVEMTPGGAYEIRPVRLYVPGKSLG